MLQTDTVPFKTAGIPRVHCAGVQLWFMPGVEVAPAPVSVPVALLVADPLLPSIPPDVALAVLDVSVSLALVLFASWRRITLIQRLMLAALVG